MIETGEWVRCDAALDRPDRPATQIAAEGDWKNLLRCGRYAAFLSGNRQKGWAAARRNGWSARPDPHQGDVTRNLCPRHTLFTADRLTYMPLRLTSREHTEDVALALADALAEGHSLAAQLEHIRRRNVVLAQDLAEMDARAARHRRLLASERAAAAAGEGP